MIVLGAPSGSADDETTEHVAAERRLIIGAVGLGLPVLGVCFGAQLLAVALGGRIVRNGVLEVGMGAAALTAAGRADPVLGSDTGGLEVLHWHRQSYTLPPGAVRLATSDRCAEQAFRVAETSTDSSFTSRSTANWRDALPTKCLRRAGAGRRCSR